MRPHDPRDGRPRRQRPRRRSSKAWRPRAASAVTPGDDVRPRDSPPRMPRPGRSGSLRRPEPTPIRPTASSARARRGRSSIRRSSHRWPTALVPTRLAARHADPARDPSPDLHGAWVGQYTIGPPRFSDRASTIHLYGVAGGSNQFLKGKFQIALFPPADPGHADARQSLRQPDHRRRRPVRPELSPVGQLARARSQRPPAPGPSPMRCRPN